MRNTYMTAGPAKLADVVKAAGKGIYVEDVSNGQVKIGEGDFAFYVSQGRMIENGKLGAPIKDVNIMGNGPKMLANSRDCLVTPLTRPPFLACIASRRSVTSSDVTNRNL